MCQLNQQLIRRSISYRVGQQFRSGQRYTFKDSIVYSIVAMNIQRRFGTCHSNIENTPFLIRIVNSVLQQHIYSVKFPSFCFMNGRNIDNFFIVPIEIFKLGLFYELVQVRPVSFRTNGFKIADQVFTNFQTRTAGIICSESLFRFLPYVFRNYRSYSVLINKTQKISDFSQIVKTELFPQ